jgi:RHS repeat-associated protein
LLTRWKESYSYDSRDRLTKSCMDEACSRYYEYAYDEVGNRLSQTTQKATTRYSYDAADELQTETTGDKVTLYAYDLNGNETRAGDTHYAYNLENKLTSQKGAGKQASYTYTGEGLVSTRRIPSETTSYAWDTSEDLPELTLETVSKGKKSQTSVYTFGEGPIGIINESGSYSFHTDSLGSVVELSDTGGQSVESYRYSPYGEAYSPGDSAEASSRSSNPIRFAGQYLDSEADLYNMRARQYEPETGRFLEVDPIEASAGETYLGVYIYADDKPTLNTDPSGMCVPVGDSLTSPCMRPKPPKPKKKSKLIYPFPKGVPKKIVGGPVHATGDLPGYPALDFGAPAGTRVLAVVKGTTWWESGGTSPSIRPKPHSVYGWIFYLKSDLTGITYFYSHLATRLVKDGPPHNHVSIGQVVGTLVNWRQWEGVDHLHLGATGPMTGEVIKRVFAARQVKPV